MCAGALLSRENGRLRLLDAATPKLSLVREKRSRQLRKRSVIVALASTIGARELLKRDAVLAKTSGASNSRAALDAEPLNHFVQIHAGLPNFYKFL